MAPIVPRGPLFQSHPRGAQLGDMYGPDGGRPRCRCVFSSIHGLPTAPGHGGESGQIMSGLLQISSALSLILFLRGPLLGPYVVW